MTPSSRLRARAGVAALVCLLLTPVALPAAEPPPQVARDQLFFASVQPEPMLAILIVQRSADASGAVQLETKVFMAHKGKWIPPFWERVKLKAWPGPSLVEAAQAWQQAGGGRDLRLSVEQDGGGIGVHVRRRQGGLALVARQLTSAGSGPDPHGEVRWHTGPATLRVNGRTFDGVLAAEHLRTPRTAWPTFGRFEMWLYGPPGGGLTLGRLHLLGRTGEGAALQVSRQGRAVSAPFQVRVAAVRPDPGSGFELPVRWQVGPKLTLVRSDGVLAHGKAPDGGKAAYDVSLALASGLEATGAMAVVFHLEDGGAKK